ncbi:MAG: hypothetical protein RLN99_14710 [Kiloniellaceae bacterium]
MTAIAEYLGALKADEAARRPAAVRSPAAPADDRDFASWLDLLDVVCPGPISHACGGTLLKSMGRQALGGPPDST